MHQNQGPKPSKLAPIYDHAAYNTNPPPYYNPSDRLPKSGGTLSKTTSSLPDPYHNGAGGGNRDKSSRKSGSGAVPETVSAKGATTSGLKSGVSSSTDLPGTLPGGLPSGLPAGPGVIGRATTIADMATAHATYQQQGHELLFKMEQMQTEKMTKSAELERKRKDLATKTAANNKARKEIEQTQREWNLEREEIIKSFGGKIPSFIIESDKLRKDLENMSNRNSALQANLEVISSHLQSELSQLQSSLSVEQRIAGQTAEHNLELERRVRELRIEKLELERELKMEKRKQKEIRRQIPVGGVQRGDNGDGADGNNVNGDNKGNVMSAVSGSVDASAASGGNKKSKMNGGASSDGMLFGVRKDV